MSNRQDDDTRQDEARGAEDNRLESAADDNKERSSQDDPKSMASDSMSEELKSLYDNLGLAQFHLMNSVTAKIREEKGWQSRPASPLAPYKYGASIEIVSGFFTYLKINFDGTDYQFSGYGGGLSLGIGYGWGVAQFNYPLQTLKNWDATYQFDLTTFGSTFYLWGMSNEYIGNITAGSLAFGAGIGGGKGQFGAAVGDESRVLTSNEKG